MYNLVNDVLIKMIDYFDGDVKRINHALKVFTFSNSIAKAENENIQFILQITSLLHDIGIKMSEKKYNSSAGNYQEIEGPSVAREILKDFNISNDILERIIFLIGHHHTYSAIDGIDFQILIEADFIVNSYEDSLDTKAIEYAKDKYFKTEAGIKLLESMYLNTTRS